jgi:two-component system chemotaxis response regulator CheB
LAEPIHIVLAQLNREPSSELAAALDASGEILVVGEMHDIDSTARAATMRSAQAVLLVADDAKAPALVTSLTHKVRVPVVVMTGSSAGAVGAMAAGAVEALPQDTPISRLVESLKIMSTLSVVRRFQVVDRAAAKASQPVLENVPSASKDARLVAIGASTGGPAALAEILGQLPKTFTAAIVIAQHMPDDYDEPFARWLSEVTQLTAKVTDDGEPLRAGVVYIPRGGQDLVLGPTGLLLNSPPTGAGPVPSADRLLSSVARMKSHALFGIVLTGMGRDGMLGLKAMRQAGAVTLAQDSASSVVASMPDAARESGAATLSLPPQLIAQQLLAWSTGVTVDG